MYEYLARLLTFWIPVRKLQKEFKNRLQHALEYKKIQERYKKKLQELRQKEKINVVFLVWENAKWNGDSLYKKLEADPRFNPQVIIGPAKRIDPTETIQFFKQRTYKFSVVTNGPELRAQKPDILFFQQPWFALGDFSPAEISKYALCLYFPYTVATDIELPHIFDNCIYFGSCPDYSGCVLNQESNKE